MGVADGLEVKTHVAESKHAWEAEEKKTNSWSRGGSEPVAAGTNFQYATSGALASTFPVANAGIWYELMPI